MTKKIIVILLFFVLSTSAFGALKGFPNGKRWMFSVGWDSCEDYIGYIMTYNKGNFGSDDVFNNWMFGYLAYYNVYVSKYNMVTRDDSDFLHRYTRNYCEQNPKMLFKDAVDSLILRLLEKHNPNK